MTTQIKVTGSCGRPYGHVPGHNFHDVDVIVRGTRATLIITWGSAQGRGCDEEHGRTTIARRAGSAASAVEAVRDAALAEHEGEEDRRYIEGACADALEQLAALEAA